MKRLILILLLLYHSNLYAQAVPSLPELTVAQPGDLLYVVRPTDAQPDRKMTVENMRVFMSQGLNAACSGAARVATINAGITTCKSASIDRVTATNLPPSPTTGDVVVVTDALNGSVCATPGGTSNNTCQWNGSTWVVVGGAGGVGGVNEASPYNWSGQHTFTIDPTVNGSPMCLLNGTNCPAAGNESDPVVGAISGVPKGDGKGAISAANATDLPYTPAGTIASNTVGGAIGELDSETQTALSGKQPADADLTALAANATAGFWAAGTNVARSFANGTGITWTNPAGVAGNPQANVDSTVARSGAAWTAGNFDYDFGGAASVGWPRATGAAPTTPGRCAFDTTASPQGRYKCGLNNGSTITLAFLSEVQLSNANLTALSNLVGVNGKIPYFTGAGAMALTSGLETACPDSGGQHLNLTSIGTFVCGNTSSGALSGGVATKLLVYNSATTAIPSIVTESGGNINIAGGLNVGDVSTNFWRPDFSAITGEKVWTFQNMAGIPLVATTEGGAITDTNVAVFKTTGGITRIVNGGAAGAGTWTDTNTVAAGAAQNKTLIDALAGGGTGMVVKSQLVASFDGGALTPKTGSGCSNPPSSVVLNSGDAPEQYVLICPTAATASFGVVLPGIKQAIGTIFLRLKVNDAATGAPDHFAGLFKAQCRASGTAPNSTWGTTQAVDITMTTGLNTYQGVTAALTPNGTCSINSDLYVQFDADGNMSDGGNARIVALIIEQQS